MAGLTLPGIVGSGRGITAGVLGLVAATLVAFLIVIAALLARLDLPARLARAMANPELPVPVASLPAPGNAGPVVVGDRAAWFTSEDYPPEAIRRDEEGRVKVRLAVDAAGRARACAVVESSGSVALDRGTCRIFVRRAWFQPGRPGSIDMAAVRWVLP